MNLRFSIILLLSILGLTSPSQAITSKKAPSASTCSAEFPSLLIKAEMLEDMGIDEARDLDVTLADPLVAETEVLFVVDLVQFEALVKSQSVVIREISCINLWLSLYL